MSSRPEFLHVSVLRALYHSVKAGEQIEAHSPVWKELETEKYATYLCHSVIFTFLKRLFLFLSLTSVQKVSLTPNLSAWTGQ